MKEPFLSNLHVCRGLTGWPPFKWVCVCVCWGVDTIMSARRIRGNRERVVVRHLLGEAIATLTMALKKYQTMFLQGLQFST